MLASSDAAATSGFIAGLGGFLGYNFLGRSPSDPTQRDESENGIHSHPLLVRRVASRAASSRAPATRPPKNSLALSGLFPIRRGDGSKTARNWAWVLGRGGLVGSGTSAPPSPVLHLSGSPATRPPPTDLGDTGARGKDPTPRTRGRRASTCGFKSGKRESWHDAIGDQTGDGCVSGFGPGPGPPRRSARGSKTVD